MSSLTALLLIAAAFWGQTPDCGQPSLTSAELPPPVVGFADLADCSIVVDPRRFYFSGAACVVVVHEYGHLIGLGHSDDPTNVMYPVMQQPLRPCKW